MASNKYLFHFSNKHILNACCVLNKDRTAISKGKLGLSPFSLMRESISMSAYSCCIGDIITP